VGEHDVLVFLLALGALLTSARLLGEVARRLGLPLVAGEILGGVILGPTVLGRFAPTAEEWLFGPGPARTALSGYTTVAVVLLLVVAGIEVDLDVVMRRGRSALVASVLGIVIPLGGGFALGLALPSSDLVDPSQRMLFALFMGVALSISALPVIAKTLLDFGLFKTEIGLLVMAVAMIDDLLGWLGFSILLGPLRGANVDTASIRRTVGLTLLFVAACLFVLRPLLDRLFARLQKDPHTAPRRILSVVVLLALFGGAFTHAIGVHAVFGGFAVGVVAGESAALKERTRAVIHEFVTTIFAPVVFATLGLKLDFVDAFDPVLCLLVFAVASGAKILGCTLGARMGGLAWRPSAAVGFGLNARGAMEIILALLALEAGLLKPQVFVALVCMALGTSILSGPAMKWFLRPEVEEDVSALLRNGAFIGALEAKSSLEAIRELVLALQDTKRAAGLDLEWSRAMASVLEREQTAPTGLGDEVAIPHASVDGLARPMLALGRSQDGVDFDAPDGRPARIVVLLLMPPRAYDQEVRLLASLARALFTVEARDRLLRATNKDDVERLLGQDAAKEAEARRTHRASLADI
jgi:Kef-type K+ transport system membrane component KefB/mannitol/fructose-specific phosphotransferase system IIA component (Ntr-type)